MDLINKIPKEYKRDYIKGYESVSKCKWKGRQNEMKKYICNVLGDCANYPCNSCDGIEKNCEYWEE